MLASPGRGAVPDDAEDDARGDDDRDGEERRKPDAAPLGKASEGEGEEERGEKEEGRRDPRFDPVTVRLPGRVLAAGVHAAAVEPEESLEEPPDSQADQREDAEAREPAGSERAPQAQCETRR